MIGTYTEEELEQLHEELYEILDEIIRVCEENHIPYFIQGGTAIGAHFEQAILPWDDDIDIGMTRRDYNRFVKIAPRMLKKGYFMQHVYTDPNTPFYFTKIRKDRTLFVEEDFAHMDIHQGIFVDVFPFDKVPDNQCLQKLQRLFCNFLNCCFMGKSIWMWKHCGKCEIKQPTNRGFLPCMMNRIVDMMFNKRSIYKMLSAAQGWFNNIDATYYNMVLMPRDHIAVKSIENAQQVKFGPLMVTAPNDLETYLKHHYRNLRKHIPKEEQQNHRPIKLSFDTTKDKTEV